MRTNGGTIYTFSSAVEDIGLNINERNNIVKISNFALLNIPNIDYPQSIEENKFNSYNGIAGSFEYNYPGSATIKDGRVIIAESFENYALNLESNLLNQDNYDPTLIRTVSERVFWKWLKETGAIRWSKDVSTASKQYWSEEMDADGSLGYNSVVKYVGQVSAGNVRTDTFGTYNETYILIPTSHGQMDAYFEIVEDENYKHGMQIGDLGEKILGRENYTLPHPDGLNYNAYYDFVDSSTSIAGGFSMDYSIGSYTPGWWYSAEGIEPPALIPNFYFTDTSSYINSGIYNTDLRYSGSTTIEFRRSKVDCLSLVFNLDELKEIYNDSTLTYDKMAIQDAINDAFEFNAVLIYYTVYNSTQDQVLGRNLLGVLFIDAPSGSTQNIGSGGIIIPSLEKIASGPGGFGTSYSLRLNIKTDNMVDDTGATIVDMATSDQIYAEDWTEAFANLNTAVNLLTQNTSVIKNISENYIEVQSVQTQIINDLQALQFQVNDIGRDIAGVPNTIAMFANGDDPLVESSIYMRFGNIGVNMNMPQYPFHIVGTTKADEIIIENAIRDTSGNILLGYGSPLQLGASTNYREVDVYTGNIKSALHFDTSNNASFRGDVSVAKNFYADGSSYMRDLFVTNILSSSFDFEKSYIADGSVGPQFLWNNGYLEVISGTSDVSASGTSGDIQFNLAGSLFSDPSFYWNPITQRLGIYNREPSAALHVGKSAIIDGSLYVGADINFIGNLYKNGVAFSSGITWSGSTANGVATYGSASSVIAESTLKYDGTYRIFSITPGNTSPTLGVAQLGMANFAIGSAQEQDYLYTGAVILGKNSALGSYWSGWVSKSYRGNEAEYTYSHIGVTDTGELYFKYNNNSTDGAAAIGGTWTRTFDNRHTLQPLVNSLYDLGLSTTNRFRNLYFTPSAAKTSNVLYYDSTTGAVTYGAISSGGGGNVSWASGSVGSNNYMITANGDGSIVAESNITFDGSVMQFATGASRTIKMANTSNSFDYSLSILGQSSSYTSSFPHGGNLILGSGNAGNLNGALSPGNGGDVSIFSGVGTTNSYFLYSGGNGGIIEIKAGSGGDGTGFGSFGGDGGDILIIAGLPGNGYSGGSAGNIQIYPGSGNGKVYINNNGSSNYGQAIFSGAVSAISPAIAFNGETNTGFYKSAVGRISITTSGTQNFMFDVSSFHAKGNVIAYSTSISDIRLKDNVEDLENSLDKVLQLRGISYDLKSTGDKHAGFIAQEIEKVIPNIIVETNLLGEPEDIKYKTVKYTEIIPYLAEAIKEQQKMIDELRKEINELKK